MTRALAQPALQALAAAATLLAFTWPFLVYDRPIQVFASLFVSWSFIIALLFAFSRAGDCQEADGLESKTDEEENV
jgi:hypothetical protein